MILEIGVEHHLMHEACSVRDACRIGSGVGAVSGQVEMEVGEVFFQLAEVVEIEDLV